MSVLLTFVTIGVTALMLIGAVWVVKKTFEELEQYIDMALRNTEERFNSILKRLEQAELKIVAMEKKFLLKKTKKGADYDA